MEWMKSIKDNFFNLAVVDPPYGKGQFTHKNKNYSPKKITWNNKIPDKEYFQELFRISDNQLIWGGNYFTEHLPPTNSWLIWDKKQGDPFKSRFSRVEMAWTSYKIAANLVTIPWASGFFRKRKETIIHECQKPINIYKWIYEHYLKPGMKICDTHIGSGSSRIAAYDMGFYFEGCENDHINWRTQENRFKDYLKRGKELFGVDEMQDLTFNNRKCRMPK